MAGNAEEETTMKRKKRFSIKILALGFAVAAIAAPTAQALNSVESSEVYVSASTPTLGSDDRALPLREPPTIGVDDRAVALRGTPSVHPDDRALQVRPVETVVVDDGSGFEIGTTTMSAIVLLLAAALGATAIVIHQGRKARLASA